MRKLLLIPFWIICFYANAEDCESIISLSKITNSEASDKNSVEQSANYFCQEYSKGTNVSNDSKFGASFKFLSANYGSSSATVTEVASKYCSASSGYSTSNDAYKKYVESIAPGAYGAYQQCLDVKKNMKFNVDTVLPAEFSITVGFVSQGHNDNKASVSYSASSGVTCHWNGSETNSIEIPTGSTYFLECKRPDQTKKSFVKIIRTDSTESPPLTLSWQAYDVQGNPINTLIAFDERIKVLETELSQLQDRSVVGFMSEKCPYGWTPVQNAQGRFLRGIDSSGSTKIDPSGIRIPGSVQEDMLAKHTHIYKSGFHDGQSNSGTGADPNKKDSVLTETDEGRTKGGELGPETRPKNMAVLFCTKINS